MGGGGGGGGRTHCGLFDVCPPSLPVSPPAGSPACLSSDFHNEDGSGERFSPFFNIKGHFDRLKV